MTISDWINLIAAILIGAGTLFLGIMAWRTIRQTRSIQNSERKERLLNEIIEWAISVLKLNSDLHSFTESIRLAMSRVSTKKADELYSDTIGLRDKGKYIKITANIAGDKADDAATKLQNELTTIANLLGTTRLLNEISPEDTSKLVTTEDEMLKDKDENQDTIEKHRKKLAPLCNLIIEEVANIKTRDVG